MSEIKTTDKVQKLFELNRYNKRTLSEELGISRPTLNERLEKHNWKKLEVERIEELY